MKKNKGFILADLVLAIGIIALIFSAFSINYFKEYKQNIAKEIASSLIAIDRGFNTLALSQQIIHTYRGERTPTPFPSLTSSETDETDYVEEILRKSYGRDLRFIIERRSDASGVSLIDPRINLKKLAQAGYTFTFNIRQNYILDSISVNGLDDELNDYLANILKDRWDRNTKTFRLNNGRGYRFDPVYVNRIVNYRKIPVRRCGGFLWGRRCTTQWLQVPVYGQVLIGYRLNTL